MTGLDARAAASPAYCRKRALRTTFRAGGTALVRSRRMNNALAAEAARHAVGLQMASSGSSSSSSSDMDVGNSSNDDVDVERLADGYPVPLRHES
jgi:hypothetical protein